MSYLGLHRYLALLAVGLGLLISVSVAAQETPSPTADAELVAGWQTALDRAEIAVSQGRNLNAAEFEDAKQALNRVLGEAQALQSRGQGRLLQAKAELASLGPAPEDTAPPEDQKVAETRTRLQQDLSSIQGNLSQAQLAIVRSQNLLADIGRLEQSRMTAHMLARGRIPLKPDVWAKAGQEAARVFDIALAAPGIWWDKVEAQDLDETTVLAGISLLILSAVVGWPLRRWILHRWGATAQDMEPSHTRRVLAAGTTGLAEVLLPAVALAAIIGVAHLTAPSEDDYFVSLVHGAGLSLIIFFIVVGLTNAALSPRLSAWRVVPATTLGARRLSTNIALLAGFGAVAYFIYYAANESGTQVAEFTAVLTFSRSLILMGFFLALLRRSNWLEPGAAPKCAFWPVARLILAVVAIAGPILALAGYIGLARFVHLALVLSIVLIGAALLLRAVLHEGLVLILAPPRAAGAPAPTRQRNLAFWAGILVDIALWPPVVYILLLSYGLSPALLRVWINTALTGISIGEVNLSLIDMAMAIFIAVFGLLIVGWMKRWLADRVMPHTRFDIGLQNSLTAGFSYLGAIIVLMLAILALGIDLSSLAIVAGALSVGIGFGLKTVVENFVAGVLLLIERPMKVGDWIVVGSNEGIVKRISVRSTEIQTFDHATVIIPNSDLISQSVINWTHKNRMVRVIITVGVAYGSDTRLVRQLLIKCAEKHPHVVAEPAPAVVFRSFADSALDFELRTFVDDADYVGEVRNDINFAIDDAFREHGILIPFPQRELHIRTGSAVSLAAMAEPDRPAKPGSLLASRDDYD